MLKSACAAARPPCSNQPMNPTPEHLSGMNEIEDKLHAIRNQLTTVTGYGSLLSMSADLSPEHRLMAEKIAEAGLQVAADLQAIVDLAMRSAPTDKRHLGGHDGHELDIGGKR
jgi:hypothetical protein